MVRDMDEADSENLTSKSGARGRVDRNASLYQMDTSNNVVGI
jgi:hypothetical protein